MTGALAPNPANPFVLPPGSISPFDLEVDAAGAHLFVSQDFSNNVGVYDIGVGGALTPDAGSPFPAGRQRARRRAEPDRRLLLRRQPQRVDQRLHRRRQRRADADRGLAVRVRGLGPRHDAGQRFPHRLQQQHQSARRLRGQPRQRRSDGGGGLAVPRRHRLPGGIVSAGGYVFVANGFFNPAASTVSAYQINAVSGRADPGCRLAVRRGVASAATGIAFHAAAPCAATARSRSARTCDDGNTATATAARRRASFEPDGTPCADATRVQRRRDLRRRRHCRSGHGARLRRRQRLYGRLLRRRRRLRQRRRAARRLPGAPRSRSCSSSRRAARRTSCCGSGSRAPRSAPVQIGRPDRDVASYALCVYAGGDADRRRRRCRRARKWAPASATGYRYSDPAGAPTASSRRCSRAVPPASRRRW